MEKKRNAASERTVGRPLDCTFHDLKAKGISDYEKDLAGISKNSVVMETESQVLVYDRKLKSAHVEQENEEMILWRRSMLRR